MELTDKRLVYKLTNTVDGFVIVGDVFFTSSNVFREINGNVLDAYGVTIGYFYYHVTDSNEINMQFSNLKGDVLDYVIKGVNETVERLKTNDYDFK